VSHSTQVFGAKVLEILENVSDSFIALDRDWRVLHLNARALGYLGMKREKLVGRVLWDAIPEYAGTPLEAALRRAMAEQVAVEFEWRGPHSRKWFRVNVHPSAEGVLIYGRDITEQHRVKEVLHDLERHRRDIIDAVPHLVWINTPDGRVGNFNQRWQEYTGQDRDAAEGTGWHAFVHPEDMEATLRVRNAAIARGEPYEVKYRLRGVNGSYRWFISRVIPVRDREDKITAWVGTATDMHEITAAQDALRDLNETLERRVEERTAEAQRRTDQLRVMAAELTHAEQRERRRLAQLLHDHLQQLLVAAKMRVALAGRTGGGDLGEVESLLAEAIDASRSLTVQLCPPMLHDGGLAPALEWLARRMQDEQGLAVDAEVDEAAEVPNEDLRMFLFGATRELLFNVVKHAGVKEAGLRLSRRRGRVCVEVRDAGRGFDPKRPPGGEHFGLFSIQQRIEHWGGRLEVEASPRKGCRVTLISPEVEAVGGRAEPRASAGV
jgi:PAS domain S-box-containing protein